jgi:hypothetical protein
MVSQKMWICADFCHHRFILEKVLSYKVPYWLYSLDSDF